MKRKIIVAVVVVAIVVGSVFVAIGLINSRPTPPLNTPAELVINVKEYTAKNQDYNITVNYPAKVSAKEVVKLGVLVSGQILPGNVPLKVGQKFRKGDLLVNIYSEDVEASLKSQKSQYLNTLAKSLPDIKIDFSDQYNKWAKFFEDISLDKPLPELPAISSTKEKVYLSAKSILSSYYSIKQSEIILERYKTYAPFNGVFREVTKEVGSIASPGSDVGVITSVDDLELSIGVSPLEAKLLAIGKNVKVTSDEGKHYTGRIVRVAPIVDQRTQRVTVYIAVSEPTLEIVEGQMVSAEVALNPLKDVIRVPREIINKYQQLYKIIDRKLYSTDINILMNSGEYSYIKGIEDGTKIIYESLVEPKSGTAVNVIEVVENK